MVIWMSFGTTVSIIVGQQLGANRFDEAKVSVKRIMAFGLAVSIVGMVLLMLAAPLFPRMYNTTDEVRGIATSLLIIVACYAPVQTFLHTTYFTLRSGGKTVITFIFDCVYQWVISIPLAMVLANFTQLPIVPMYLIIHCCDLIKCAMGFYMLKKGMWINNIVGDEA